MGPLLLPLLLLLARAGAVDPEVHQLATDGTVELQNGRFHEALALLERATALDPDYIIAHTNLGIAHYRLGQHEEARHWLEEARRMNPVNPGIRVNLGAVYYELGLVEASVAEFEEAAFLHPENEEATGNLKAVLGELGNRRFAEGVRLFNAENDLEAAAEQFRLATEAVPSFASAYGNLGVALFELNRRDEANAAFETALRYEKDQWDAVWALGLAYAEEGRTKKALSFFRRLATRGLAEHQYAQRARFFVAVLLWERDGVEAQEKIQRNLQGTTAFLIDSFQFAVEHAPEAQGSLLVGTFESLSRVWAMVPAEGLVMEFGVSSGQSLRHLAALAGPERALYGFDTFTGLPEDWHSVPAGTYSTGGQPPAGLGDNVALVQGLFADTLPGFLRRHRGRAALLHIDCDLYSSTRDVLRLAGDRVEAGTILVFDEFIRHHTWREDEFRAFSEAAEEFGWVYEYVHISLSSEQVAVRVLSHT